MKLLLPAPPGKACAPPRRHPFNARKWRLFPARAKVGAGLALLEQGRTKRVAERAKMNEHDPLQAPPHSIKLRKATFIETEPERQWRMMLFKGLSGQAIAITSIFFRTARPPSTPAALDGVSNSQEV